MRPALAEDDEGSVIRKEQLRAKELEQSRAMYNGTCRLHSGFALEVMRPVNSCIRSLSANGSEAAGADDTLSQSYRSWWGVARVSKTQRQRDTCCLRSKRPPQPPCFGAKIDSQKTKRMDAGWYPLKVR